MGDHRTHTMHAHSLAAYATLDLKGRKKEIVDALRQVGMPMTDRQIAVYLDLGRDGVQPRVSDLVDDGVLVEVDKVQCPVTGHIVRRVRVAL